MLAAFVDSQRTSSLRKRGGEGAMRLQEAALRIDGRPVTAAEVLAGALVGGFADELIDRAAGGIAAASLAAEKAVEATATEIQAALDGWRKSRDLVAADDFRAWMASEGFDLKGVARWLERDVLRERLALRFRQELQRRRPALAELIPSLHEEAVMSGLQAELSEELALRLVAPAPGEEQAEELEAARAAVPGLLDCADFDGLVALVEPLGVTREAVGNLIEAELAYRALRSREGKPESLEEELREFGRELVRFEVADADFANEDVAREVVCCVREDGDSFRRSASRAGQAARLRVLMGAELDRERFGHRISVAAPKDLFGPVSAEGRHHLAQLVRRLEPDLRSDRVREELTDRLVRRRLQRSLAERVVFPVGEVA